MIYPNVKAMFKRKEQPDFRLMSEEFLAEQLAVLQQACEIVEAGIGHMQSAEWKWLTERFLQSESIRLALDATQLDPMDAQYERKRLIADGQIAQNRRIAEKLLELEAERDNIRDQIERIQRQLETLRKRRIR